jgi:hypothetical protein
LNEEAPYNESASVHAHTLLREKYVQEAEANAAYIYFKDITPGEVVKTFSCNSNPTLRSNSNIKYIKASEDI